jgi:hypothetical protein
MSGLPTPFSTRGWGRRLAFQSDGVRRRRLGGIGGIELEPGLEIADPLFQLSDPALEGTQEGQDGDLGRRRDHIPERLRDRRLRDHDKDITKLLYRKFDP